MLRKILSLQNTKLRIYLVILIGFVLIISPQTAITFSDIKETSFWYKTLVVLTQIGKTFFAAGLIALILNVPSLLNDVDNSSLRLLQNNEFLRRLSVPELFRLRKQATKHALSHSTESIDFGLERLDEKFSDLLRSPYYQFYKVRIKNTLLENGNINKLVTQEFKIINPSKEPISAKKHIEIRSLFKDSDIPKDQLRKLKKMEVVVDDNKTYGTKDFKLCWSEKDEAFPIHDIDSKVVRSNNEGEELKFTDSLYINLKEEREVTSTDNTYIKRLRFPAKTFSIHYFFDSCDVDLIGNGFETFFSETDSNINIDPDPNSLNISSNNWLLSGNGIMIVHNIKNVSKKGKNE